MAKQNHYEVLGVPRDADDATIKKAYRKAASQHHPDKKGGDAETMKKVNDAYAVLSNPTRRKAFDEGRDDKEAVDELTAFIMQHFIAVVGQDYGGSKNWVKETSKRIALEKEKVLMNQKQLQQQLRLLEKSEKFLKFKGEGKGLLIQVIENRIAALKTALATVAKDLELVESAFKFLKDYEWIGPEIEDHFARYTTANTAGGPFRGQW